MSQIREIAQLGATVLREQAQPVEEIHSAEIQDLMADLVATLASTNGVGIAAPQIAASWRIIIVASRPSERYPFAPEMSPTLMINPYFTALSETQEKDWEGCLSIPSIRAQVPRFTQIQIHYTDVEGQSQSQRLEGFVARVFQHEYDHLNGIVYLDRVENNRDIIAEVEWTELMRQQKKCHD